MKQKLLWIGDDPRSKSGYGRVLNEMLPYLSSQYEITILAIGYKGSSYKVNIIDSSDGTPFGFKSIIKIYNEIKPDIFILLNDHKIIWGWLNVLNDNCNLSNTKIIPYVCTEYIGIHESDMNIFNKVCHHIFVMANFTGDEMKKRGCIIPYTRISHGYPLTLKKHNKQEARKLLNISENAFVFYSGNRNQPRKRIDIIIRAYVEFLKKYSNEDVLLLMNCGLIDIGIDIPEFYKRLCKDNKINNFESKIYYCNNTIHPSEFNDQDLSIIYSCCDVGITTSTGESFGLIPFEMSFFDIPQIIPNYGGIIETMKEGCIKVNPSDYYVYPSVLQSACGEGAIVHYKDIFSAMEMYYTKKELYMNHSQNVKNNLIGYSWEEVSKFTIKVIEELNVNNDTNINHNIDNSCHNITNIDIKYKIPSKELIDEYQSLIKKHQFIFDKMNYFLKLNNEFLEGGCVYEHGNYECIEDKTFFNKQLNLYDLSKTAKNIIEIGFNLGNSALLFLLSSKDSKIICFDLCEHKYAKLCFTYLDELFPNRMTLIEGDSTKTIPTFYEKKYNNYFDLIHIDGGHQKEIAHQDFINTYKMANNLIIFDDDNIIWIDNLIKQYIQNNLVDYKYHFKTINCTHALLLKTNQVIQHELKYENMNDSNEINNKYIIQEINDKSKIIITGFPHCGTTILKSIIGHIDEINEITTETPFISKEMIIPNKKILIKHPWIKVNYFSEKTILEDFYYNDFNIIFIIRNPYCVFSSINNRFNNQILENGYSIEEYLKTLTLFDYYKNNPKNNIFTILYEDLFNNDYYICKKILEKLNLKFNNNIFDNEKYKNENIGDINQKKNDYLRNQQINTKFENKNNYSNLNLTLLQIEQLSSHPIVQKYYPINNNNIQKINSNSYQVKF